jgi:hypothetical protein
MLNNDNTNLKINIAFQNKNAIFYDKKYYGVEFV